ncbi:MAG: hypothetical protein HKL87_00390 [Acidimicrobiaceae bacterium]|jgi:hypothetical protein|nr:hypothetical protein [Acidimicrobiaceae bacterium]
MLDDLAPTALPRLLRRTVWSALVLGTVGFVVAVLISPLAGLGEALGVVLAILNLRQTDKQIAAMEVRVSGDVDPNVKALRRQLRPKVIGRLGIVTLLVFGALFLSRALGLGIVTGLIIYYVVFVINVYGVVANQRGLD